ncbi:Zn-ribbon domain-containing OB-fold protein [Collinsella tanakaei]|uniref:Zn-ribbon domain-containing OB-fold protein n=1 Tax=Collinsella tanakaei TaxID=626935 RepID=UPI0039F466CA
MLLENMEPVVKKFYDGVAEGKYLGRKCTECGAIEFPPHLGCNTCGHGETEWVELSGHGTLVSFVIPGIQNDKPYLKEIAPYGYGAVELDEGPIYTFVIFCGKKKIVKGLQERLHAGEKIGVHAKPIQRVTPVKAGEPETVEWSELCFELDEVAVA